MKLCIQCKYLLPSLREALDDNSRCGFEHPISLVTGLQTNRDTLPYAELDRRTTGRCTPLATNWEAADHVMTEEEELLKGNIGLPQGEAHE
jgi:hypothetical protein